MIYELALVAKSEISEDQVKGLQELVTEVVGAHAGEVLLVDDWGKKTMAQPTSNGVATGHFLYFIYKANNENNVELNRRFKISEEVLKQMIIKLDDEDANGEALVKSFKSPFSKAHNGSLTDSEDGSNEDAKDKRKFARRKTCWFAANKIKADWKDPQTYNWLINEFGKISPARISGISRKHQRFAEVAIKRARNIGVASHLTGRFAE